MYVDDAVDFPAPISRSVGDLTRLMDNIHKEQLTFDGKDKRKQRTSAILPTDGAPVETPVESIETLKRKHSLMRTLKVIIKCTRWLRSNYFLIQSLTVKKEWHQTSSCYWRKKYILIFYGKIGYDHVDLFCSVQRYSCGTFSKLFDFHKHWRFQMVFIQWYEIALILWNVSLASQVSVHSEKWK